MAWVVGEGRPVKRPRSPALALLNVLRRQDLEESAANNMANSISLCERSCNVPGRCLTVGVHTLCSDNCVEGLESFGGKEDSRAKSTDVVGEVNQNMKLRLVEPCGCPASSANEKLVYLVSQGVLVAQKFGLVPLEDVYRINAQGSLADVGSLAAISGELTSKGTSRCHSTRRIRNL